MRHLLAVSLVAMFCGCGPDQPVAPEAPAPPVEPPEDASYRVKPPEGKLPLPQHGPSFTEEEHAAMRAQLFVINNFGVYQGGSTPESMYLHDGVDLVLRNGTPIYAVEAGTVRAIQSAGNGQMVLVEDADEPGRAWGYVHVGNVSVRRGQKVGQGTLLAQVQFNGIEHLHLDRLERPAGASWTDFFGLIHHPSAHLFDIPDTQPPLFEGTFRYYVDGSDTTLPADSLQGDVDIVVGLRDPGEHHHDRSGFGDRHAIQRLEYELEREGAAPQTFPSFDFSRLLIARDPTKAREAEQAQTVYRFYRSIHTDTEWWRRPFSFYTLTHAPMEGLPRPLARADTQGRWRTNALNERGERLFPDGDYTLTVRAWDSAGNRAERSETVKVRNGVP
jgi:hypothetical protein